MTLDAQVVAAVERKSLPDLVSSLINGTLRYTLGELSTLPRAAAVVEDHYSHVFKLDRIRPPIVADGLAELRVRWPGVLIVFCETRKLGEEWTYRYLAAAHAWATIETAALARIGSADAGPDQAEADPPEPSARELRAWARTRGLSVPDCGRLRPEILTAWRDQQVMTAPQGDLLVRIAGLAVRRVRSCTTSRVRGSGGCPP